MTRIVRVAFIAILVTLLLATASCDNEQPLSVEGQQIDIYFSASGASVPLYRVWELTKDTDPGGAPDDINGDGTGNQDDVTLWCERADDTNPNSVPWDFAFQVSVLRAGSAVPEVITSEAARTETGNTTPYDDRVQDGVAKDPVFLDLAPGVCSNNADKFCNSNGAGDSCGAGSCVAGGGATCTDDPTTACDPDRQGIVMGDNPPIGLCEFLGQGSCVEGPPGTGTCSRGANSPCDLQVCRDSNKGICEFDTQPQRFIFNNASRLSAASLTVLNAGPNVLTELCAGDFGCIDELDSELGGGTPLDPPLGECPGDPLDALGTAGLDPLTDDINPSSTVFGVDIKKGDTIIVTARLSDDVPADGGVIPFSVNPGLAAVVMVDGTQLLATEVEGNLSTGPDATAISFSFTSR